MYPPAIEKLIRHFSSFPGVGPKMATRFAFYCLTADKKEIEKIREGLKEIKEEVGSCKLCYRSISKEQEICNICSSSSRDKELLCVVEKESDLVSMERSNEYRGLYFILGGTVSPLKKRDFQQVRGKELKKRVEDPSSLKLPPLEEVIIATNQTTEGDATALYITRLLRSTGVKISRLGRGLPTGGELEYADEDTISWAFKSRK